MYTARRGRVNISIIDGVTKGVDFIAASNTQNLIQAALTLMNERDSINEILANPTTQGGKLYNGIKDQNKEAELTTALAKSRPKEPIYARDINTLIKYTNELSQTAAKSRYVMKSAPCSFYQDGVTIHKVDPETTVPDRQDVDPITGEPIFNPDGTPKMVPGFKNPVPVLDEHGNPIYYTVTHQPILVEGPPITTPDVEQVVRICNNPGIQCDNRSVLTGWARSDTASGNIVNICTNINRVQLVLENVSGGVGTAVDSVAKGELIKADTFNGIARNLKAVSISIGEQTKTIMGGNENSPACYTTCQMTCQISCQTSCQISCQGCYSGTCHNQNCGGWSMIWLTIGVTPFLLTIIGG